MQPAVRTRSSTWSMSILEKWSRNGPAGLASSSALVYTPAKARHCSPSNAGRRRRRNSRCSRPNPKRRLFAERAPECAATTRWFRNGVDLGLLFSGAFVSERPLVRMTRRTIVFTGDMGYWPHRRGSPLACARGHSRACADTVRRRVRHRRRASDRGGRAPRRGRYPGDRASRRCSPACRSRRGFGCSLQLARGVQNKVLEGMAMGKVVRGDGMG